MHDCSGACEQGSVACVISKVETKSKAPWWVSVVGLRGGSPWWLLDGGTGPA